MFVVKGWNNLLERRAGSHNQETTTPILVLCYGIFTDQGSFRRVLNKIWLVRVTILNPVVIICHARLVIGWKGLVSWENQSKNKSVSKNAVP